MILDLEEWKVAGVLSFMDAAAIRGSAIFSFLNMFKDTKGPLARMEMAKLVHAHREWDLPSLKFLNALFVEVFGAPM